MKTRGGRRDVLEVGEDAAGLEHGEDLGLERAHALVLEVVDGKRRHDAVEPAQVWKGFGEVVVKHFHRLTSETLAGAVEHRLGDIDRDGLTRGPVGAHAASRRPSPVPRSRIRRASRGTCSSMTLSPSARWGTASTISR